MDPDGIPEVTVALQGTLDTFALSDVLRLLASTRKTGRLHVTAGGGRGSIHLEDGHIVATEGSSPAPSSAVEVIFELLCFEDGSFVFEPGLVAAEPVSSVDLEPLLAEAERMLEEWKAIEAVVPSKDAWVALAPQLVAEVVVDPVRWRTVAAIGSGAAVWAVGEALGLGEIPARRAVMDVVELGLATVSLCAPAEPAGSPHEGFGISLPLDDQVARQLASLSPQAARAVAAAAGATTEEERGAGPADATEDGEPINRGLLLKFLSLAAPKQD